MKIKLTQRHPRNPMVAAARFRQAGSHRTPGGSQRQQAARSLAREVERLKHSP
jgi:hypothetical protein